MQNAQNTLSNKVMGKKQICKQFPQFKKREMPVDLRSQSILTHLIWTLVILFVLKN
jgi:hypothetical protein